MKSLGWGPVTDRLTHNSENYSNMFIHIYFNGIIQKSLLHIVGISSGLKSFMHYVDLTKTKIYHEYFIYILYVCIEF